LMPRSRLRRVDGDTACLTSRRASTTFFIARSCSPQWGDRPESWCGTVEGMTEEYGVGSLVRLEVSLDGRLEVTSNLIWHHGEVQDDISNGAVQPTADTVVDLVTVVGAGQEELCR
jgi:hypothetical protein